jgi:carbamoyl-phosphate synthase large subunit
MNNKNFNVLVTAAGGIIGEGIIKCLNWANSTKGDRNGKGNPSIRFKIIAADMNAQAAGLYRCERGILLPTATSTEYIDRIIQVSKGYDIDAIYVGSDEELVTIARSLREIESETGAEVISNPLNVINITRDKWKTFEFLQANNFSCTESCLPEDKETFIEKHGFPLVVKPREGYGSRYFSVVGNHAELDCTILKIEQAGWRAIIQEYLKGNDTEFTTGITVDKMGRHVMSSISIQKTIRHGQTYRGVIDSFDDVRRPCEPVAIKLGARGPINIQAKVVNNDPKIFEINGRFSATCPMRAVAGVNEPDIVFRNVIMNEDIREYEYEKLLCMRYWNEVYISHSSYRKTLDSQKVEINDSFIPAYF